MIGFIGAGNMATALLRGMVSGGVALSTLSAFDINADRLSALSDSGVSTFHSLSEIAKRADMLILAVKPKDCASVLDALREMEWKGSLVSIAAGWTQKRLESELPSARGIARVMPNTPALVREAVLAINENHTLESQSIDVLRGALSACGQVLFIPEALFNAVISLSGSGPAYAYLFIEAMADAGVREGLPRQVAYTLAAQTLRGAATMVLATGEHPGKLKDDVCSPGGTTIEAVSALEQAGFRAAVMEAVRACAAKGAQMTSALEGDSK